jgi:hypothetical protein
MAAFDVRYHQREKHDSVATPLQQVHETGMQLLSKSLLDLAEAKAIVTPRGVGQKSTRLRFRYLLA